MKTQLLKFLLLIGGGALSGGLLGWLLQCTGGG